MYLRLRHELRVTWRLLRHNLTVAFVPPFLLAAGQLVGRDPPASRADVARVLGAFVLVFAGFAYVFDIANQGLSREEDRLNKPSRPLPAGLASQGGMLRRWAAAWLLYPCLCYAVAGAWPGLAGAVAWEVLIVLNYVWPRWADTPVGRNTFTPLGAWIQISMALGILDADTAPTAARLLDPWTLLIPCWFVCTIHLQEPHDVAGDAQAGRRTLSMVSSPAADRWLRWSTGAFVLAFAALFGYLGATPPVPERLRWLVTAIGLLQAGLAVSIAAATLRQRDRGTSDFTYRYVYAALFAVLMFYCGVMGALRG
jgi:hypothetical protein